MEYIYMKNSLTLVFLMKIKNNAEDPNNTPLRDHDYDVNSPKSSIGKLDLNYFIV